MNIFTHTHTDTHTHTKPHTHTHVYVYACVYVCMYVCMYVCIHVYIHTRTHTHTHTHTCSQRETEGEGEGEREREREPLTEVRGHGGANRKVSSNGFFHGVDCVRRHAIWNESAEKRKIEMKRVRFRVSRQENDGLGVDRVHFCTSRCWLSRTCSVKGWKNTD